jgi:indole-3-glycerol phosphate synthase
VTYYFFLALRSETKLYMKVRRLSSIYCLDYAIAGSFDQPHNILEKIVWQKEKDVALLKKRYSVNQLARIIDTMPSCRNFLNGLRKSILKPAVIAEVKRASPSKGIIRTCFEPVVIAQAYERGGADCISVLTDSKFFMGSFTYLKQIRFNVALPLLCKEFIIDPIQIYLARFMGADAVLLILAILNDCDLRRFLKLAHSLGMQALVEVHTLEELDRAISCPEISLIGINNRNLETFQVELETTLQLLKERKIQLQAIESTVVSESGFYTASHINIAAQHGASAVLVGESLLKEKDIESSIQRLRGRLTSQN